MIQLIYAGSTSACFELDSTEPYFSPKPYDVYLNGKFLFSSTTNVVSLFSLKPDTEYTLLIDSCELTFRTAQETFAADVRSFGAVGDGVHDDTAAIQSALSFLPDGSRLFFPEGIWLTRPLCLRSHITLELSKGAVLLGSPDRSCYPILPGNVVPLCEGPDLMIGAFEGLARPMYQSLLHGSYCEDVSIVGEGIVDGNAQNSDFWTAFRQFETARPRLMFFNNCKNITLHGVTAKNSPSWNLHPFYSENVSFFDVKVQAPKDSPNTDAIDPEACIDVNIIGCRLSVGDDCVAIKSGKIELCRQRLQSAQKHVIRNCLMEFGHGAVTLGSEIACGVHGLTVTRCLFKSTDRGLRIKTRRGRGRDCSITDVVFDQIRMEDVITPVVINMWYNCCDPDRYSDYVKCREPLPVDDRTPHLGSFVFSNLTCTNAHAAACYIDGLPESPIDEVAFSNVFVNFHPDAQPFAPAMQNDATAKCKLGLYFNNVRKVHIENVTVQGANGPALVTENCVDISAEGLDEVK